jgi:hypothetical protein
MSAGGKRAAEEGAGEADQKEAGGVGEESEALRRTRGKCGSVVFFFCHTAEGVVEALARNDVLQSFVGEEGSLEPGDDYYTTPVAALRLVKSKGCTKKRKQEFTGIVFRAYKVRGAHDDAKRDMGDFGGGFICVPQGLSGLWPWGVLEEAVDFLPDAECVEPSPERDQAAMEATCRLIGVEPPPDWQAKRAALFEAHRCKDPRGFSDGDTPLNEQLRPPSGSVEAIRAQPRCACGNYSRYKEALCNSCTAKVQPGASSSSK